MPTYEYECTKCGHMFERFQSITEPPVKRCPECRCKVRRLFGTGAGILFKGSGFYETDYKRAGSGKSGKDAGKDGKSAGKDAGKADKPSPDSGGSGASPSKTDAGKKTPSKKQD